MGWRYLVSYFLYFLSTIWPIFHSGMHLIALQSLLVVQVHLLNLSARSPYNIAVVPTVEAETASAQHQQCSFLQKNTFRIWRASHLPLAAALSFQFPWIVSINTILSILHRGHGLSMTPRLHPIGTDSCHFPIPTLQSHSAVPLPWAGPLQ